MNMIRFAIPYVYNIHTLQHPFAASDTLSHVAIIISPTESWRMKERNKSITDQTTTKKCNMKVMYFGFVDLIPRFIYEFVCIQGICI